MSERTSGLRIGELAAAAGVSPDTIRHYERRGLLPRAARGRNGYRGFPTAALERLRAVRAALAVGFTVGELARIFGERDRGGTPCRTVRALAAAKLAELERREREIRRLRRELASLLADWDQRLAAQPAGRPARLLERLADRPTPSPPSRATALARPSPRTRKERP